MRDNPYQAPLTVERAPSAPRKRWTFEERADAFARVMRLLDIGVMVVFLGLVGAFFFSATNPGYDVAWVIPYFFNRTVASMAITYVLLHALLFVLRFVIVCRTEALLRQRRIAKFSNPRGIDLRIPEPADDPARAT